MYILQGCSSGGLGERNFLLLGDGTAALMDKTVISYTPDIEQWIKTINSKKEFIEFIILHVSNFRSVGFSDSTISQVLEQQYRMFDKLGVPYERIKF